MSDLTIMDVIKFHKSCCGLTCVMAAIAEQSGLDQAESNAYSSLLDAVALVTNQLVTNLIDTENADTIPLDMERN